MKNLTFKAAALNDGRPTVNRRSTDGQSQRRYSLTPITKRCRALMMVVFLFTLGIGQMWGAESATNNPATVEYGTGSAKKTFLNVSNTVSNCTIKTGSVACVTYGLYEMDKNWKPAFYTGPANGSSSSYNYSNAADYGFMAGSSAGSGTAANKSATSGYGAAKLKSDAEAVLYVTGITGIAVMGKDADTKNEKRLYIKVEEYAANGTCTPVGTGDGITKSSYNKSLHITTFDAGTLSGTKYYKVTLYAGYSTNHETSQIRFTKYIAPSCTKPGTPTSLAAGSVTHNSASLSWTAGANNDGHKIYIEKKSDKTKVLDWTDATSPYAASGLDPETTYTFKVKAKGATGYCELGDEASADFATEADPSATTYKVTLVPAGGTISDATGWTLNAGNYEKEVSSGTELALPTFTKDNRTFKTWRNGAVDVTSPITVTADVTLTAVWNATVENVLYSWEGGSPAIEVGGTAVTKAQDGTDAETSDINVDAVGTNATYKSIKLGGKISSGAWSGNYIQITTDEAIKTGDKVKITACTTKGDTSKKGSAQIRVGTSATGTAIVSDGGTYNDIKVTEDVPVPNTKTFTITAEGINTSTLSMTRQSTNTNCWVTKLQIVREVLVEEANIRTVTFNYNDGVTANVTVEVASGATVAAPADPTRAHYRFHEWQLGGVAYDFATAVTSNITLVADWTQLYTVTYAKGAEDATGDAPTQDELAAGEQFTVAANPFAYEGYDFSTWNDGSADYAPGVKYTMGSANVTLTAQWITATTKATVTYKDGEATLGSEEVTIGNAPTAATYTALQTKNLATFDAWYSDPDLAEAHKIADMTAVTVSKDTTFYGKWNYQYASSANIEQWVLDNGKSYDAVAQLGTLHYASNITNSLDSLNDDPSKTNRNYAYLGLKIKAGGKMLDFRLANGQTVKVKFGATGHYPQVQINKTGDYAAMSLTDNVWTYTAEGADAYISIKSPNGDTEIFKQIMINEDLKEITLPWRVTYDANGGTCATEEAIWKGSALILPSATPAVPADYTFAGWYDGDDLAGAAGANYTATKNVTLQAHYAPVVYAINYLPGDHGTGDDVIASAGWGTEYTVQGNPFTPETGWVFSGWAVAGVDGVSTLADGGSFTMPKNAVTLTAQWEDVSKVAMIVETSAKYNDLAAAIEAAEPGQTVQLIQDINQEEAILIAKNLTLDLNNKTFTVTNPSDSYSNRAIKVTAGTVIIKDGTVDALSNENHDGGCWGGLRQEGGHLTCNNVTFKNYRSGGLGLKPVGGTLILNECTVLSEIGGGLELGNATVEVNNCTFTQTGTDAQKIYGACFGMGKMGTLTINGGTYTSDNYSFYIYTSGGTINVNSGTFAGDVKTEMNNTQYPSAVGTINISGGTFDGVGENPIVFTAVTANDHISISGGVFDAPIENQFCAYGYVPKDNGDGTYGVTPKDGVCLVKIEPTSQTKGTLSGLYADGDELTINLSSGMNLGGSGKYIGVKATENFQEGDVLHLNMSTYQNSQNATAYVYGDKNATEFLFDTEEKCDENKDYYITLPAAVNGHKELYIVRTEGNKWNGGPSVMEVTRAMKPMLTAITIDGRDGVIDEANKAVAVQIPYEANLAALTVVPTIVWNEAAATNSIVVNDGSAWIEGANTYKLTDKDGDYTVYTITLTRDVQKHAVKFYDGETLLETLEVENGTSIAAGDVPADPEKEDYLFQGWAETVDGAAVDVTSFTISAAKNFYAKWAADGAIKLINKTSGAVNEDGYFITGVTATEANSEKAAAWGGTQGTSISGVNALGKIVQYNATTNQTKIKIKVYNTNSSDKYVYIHKIIEGKTTEESVETLTATSKTVVESEYYEFNDTKNRSFYLTTNSTDVKILQVKVIDDGATPMKQAGEAGYSLNLNKGRVVYYANADVAFEGLALNSASNYSVISSSEFQTTKNFSFSISSPVLLKVTTNTAKYYVSQNPDEDGTTATAITAAGTAEFNLTTTGTWYLVPSTTSNVKYTKIEFELPKAATPVIETQPATNHTFDPGDMTATVVATVSEGTLHYQWYKKATVGDDEEVGTDAATLTTTTEGTYYVVVTNVLAGHQDVSVTSEEAELGYRVTNDATLMALSYGGTAITLEDGVYNYNVELAKGTTDVPALAATATMDGYADVDINDATEFVNYEASSTVTVKSEDETETLVYTVNFYVKHDLPQVDVTATTTWNWANAAETMQKILPETKDVEQLMANIDDEGRQLKNDAEFNSQALIFSGQEALEKSGSGANTRWFAKGGHIKFNVTVPGTVEVEFSDNGNNNRRIKINNAVSTVASANNTDVKTYKAYVQPGEVTLMGVKNDGTGVDQYIRISKITFTANPTPDYTRNVSNNIGTLCVDHNVLVGGAMGATFYQIASRNELYNDKIDFEEVLPNEELKAGEPYIFHSNTGKIELFYGETVATEPVAVRGMIGSFADANLPITEENKSSIMYIAQNKLWNCEDRVGVGLEVVANRAYIDMSQVPTYADYQEALQQQQNPAPRRRVTLGRNAEQVATGIGEVQGDKVQSTKVLIDGHIYILRGEKMFDATGRLVK